MKNKRSNTPRRKRMNKEGRLQSAKKWLPEYQGNNIVKGYAKWFGVSKLGAVSELKLLGIEIDEEYILKLKKSEEELIKQRKIKKELKEQKAKQDMLDLGIPLDYYEKYIENNEYDDVNYECAALDDIEDYCDLDYENEKNECIKDEDLPF